MNMDKKTHDTIMQAEMNRERLLREIMAVDFSIIELNLYLDTHPNDMNALMLYNNYVQRSRMLRQRFESMYGPLNALMSTSRYPWQWIQGPWPWEREAL